MVQDPNFPPNLDIKPLYHQGDWGDAFSHKSQTAAIEKYGIAGRVWEAAYALMLYVNPPTGPHEWLFDPPFIAADPGLPLPTVMIELGSGTGIVASVLGRLGGAVIVTDLPEVCPLLEANLRHDSESLFVRPLAWGNEEHALMIEKEFLCDKSLTDVICSDLVYFPELLAPLLRTLLHLTAIHSPRIIISYKIRSLPKETPFWTAFGLYFTFQPVLIRRDWDSDWERFGLSFEDTMFTFVALRRPESRQWSIPSSDSQLLAGVGAQGTDTPKGDDSFDCLLLMTMAT
ncbi:hypothetical protein BDZ89DRAFT_981315 [Hymenopellis radicata]|nr:hypothetical protein BDZ89DRAFT_981315 [Hymenopellis radicata]